MDIPRPEAARKRRIRRALYGLLVLILIPLITWGLSRLKPAAPTVERATVWLDTVKRGPMTREVRGLGTLIPEEVLWIPAPMEGRVDRILALPGTPVTAETLLIELVNPELQQAAVDADYQVKAAEAQLEDARVKLQSDRLTLRSLAAEVEASYQQARLTADRDANLYKEGLLIELTMKLSSISAERLARRVAIEQERLKINEDSTTAQLAAQQARVEQLRALARLKRSQVESLKVRAGAAGVLQQLDVKVGQRVGSGFLLAKVAQPERLKAELKVPETQAKDIIIGQKAAIDTRNGVIPGHVTRIDPAVQSGTVTVDVKLDGALPQGARPDLSVDGTIELEHLESVVYVGRPAFGQPSSTVGLFRLEPDGKGAMRVQVKLGRTSVNTIEVMEGLQVGNQVILSDMSAWDAYDRVRLN
jgi:HlyD family secretion protein